jgi:peptide/nickel transport system ATP-binding protein
MTAMKPALDPINGISPTRKDPVLRVNDLVVEFKRGQSRFRAVDGISMEMSPGEIIGVVGESGSGKSTLGRAVAGFQRPTAGQVLFPTADGGLAPRDGSRGYRDIQMVFQESAAALNPRRSVRRTVWEAFEPNSPVFRRGSDPEKLRIEGEVETVLTSVGLPLALAAKRAGALSGGEKQRVAIARALAAQPCVIVCDEVVAALDVAVRAVTLNLLTRLRRETGVALLFISHDMSVVGHIADRIIVMHNGRIVESGGVSEVLDNPQEEYTQRLIESVPKLELES